MKDRVQPKRRAAEVTDVVEVRRDAPQRTAAGLAELLLATETCVAFLEFERQPLPVVVETVEKKEINEFLPPFPVAVLPILLPGFWGEIDAVD